MSGLASITAGNGVGDSSITLQVALILFFIMSAALLGLSLFALSFARRSDRRVSQMAANVEQQLLRMREQTQLPELLEELVHEMDGLSARVTSHLNSRFVPLEKAVRRADQRILRLEGKKAVEAEEETAPAPDSTPNAGATDRTAADEDAAPVPVAASRSDRTNRTARIYELADAGKQPLEIAEALDASVGEIELILNLRAFGGGGR